MVGRADGRPRPASTTCIAILEPAPRSIDASPDLPKSIYCVLAASGAKAVDRLNQAVDGVEFVRDPQCDRAVFVDFEFSNWGSHRV